MTGTRRPARDGPRRFRERSFHAWLARSLPGGRRATLPIGDDGAALAVPAGSVAVVTVDSLVEGTHFVADSPPELVGRAATSVSLSDLASKGARPAGILIALVVPPSTAPRWAEAALRGAEAAAAEFGAHVIGGDTKAGPLRALGSTAIGWARPGRLAPRTGARPGDLLLTTGTVGRGGAAYERWRRGLGPRRTRLAALLAVRPRVHEGALLARYADAMLDTSDGIAESCRLMAAASRVRVILDEARLPLDPGLPVRGRPRPRLRAAAFYGGDYELLAAVPRRLAARAGRAVRRVGGRLTVVGWVEAGRSAVLRSADGDDVPMPRAGWDPFRHGR